MTDKIIQDTYDMIVEYYEKHLKEHGVKLPSLKSGSRYTKDALTLVYLAIGYPNTRTITKRELTEFIQQFYPDVLDVQQARHLGAQKGWYILSGTRKDNASMPISSGEYKLQSLEKCYPGFTAQRRIEVIDDTSWNKLKLKYDNRCACCGSKEGHPHRYWKNTITILQKGHMNPNKPLDANNIIPQCEKCNRPDRNYWIYDNKGRVISIANEKVIDHCSIDVQKAIYTRLYKMFQGINPDEL